MLAISYSWIGAPRETYIFFFFVCYSVYCLICIQDIELLASIQFLGFGVLVFQLSLYPYLEKLLGPIIICRIAGVCFPHLGTFNKLFLYFQLINIFLHIHLYFFCIQCYYQYVGFVYTSVGNLPSYSHAFWVQPLFGIELCIGNEECIICKLIYNLNILL